MSSISLHKLQTYLDNYLQPQDFLEKAVNSVQVTNTRPITHVATGVTASLETIQKAVDAQVEALIVHHGIFRQGDPYQLTSTKYEKIKLLIKNNIALFCYHLSLDAHQKIGNNFLAARQLGLTNLVPKFEYSGATVGVIGTVKPMPFDTFQQKVSNYYQATAQSVKVVDTISKVAIISGGAHSYITQAAEAGADCFITGTVDEPVWDIAHELKISFLGFGHYRTETIGVQALGSELEKKFGLKHTFIETNNPF